MYEMSLTSTIFFIPGHSLFVYEVVLDNVDLINVFRYYYKAIIQLISPFELD